MLMKKLLALFLLAACSIPALAQVRQSGVVTHGHAAYWVTDGVIADAGAAANPSITTLGASPGPICVNSGPITGAYNAFCMESSAAGATLSLNNLGGATGGFLVTVNGVVQTFISAPSVASGYLLTDNGSAIAPTFKGYTAAGTGANQRTWGAKVRDFPSTPDWSSGTNAYNAQLAVGGGTIFVPGGTGAPVLPATYPFVLWDYFGPAVATALASESPQAGVISKRLFRAQHAGPHTGELVGSFTIETHATGGHANGPLNADYGQFIAIQKRGFETNTGLGGEIDGISIYVRQNGPDATSDPTIASDTNAFQGNIITIGKTGNSALLEGSTRAYAADTITQNFYVHSFVGAINNIDGALYGFVADAYVGAAGGGLNMGVLIRNTAGGSWDYPFRFEDSTGRILGGMNSAGQVVIGGATSGFTVLRSQAIAAGVIDLPANSTTMVGTDIVQTITNKTAITSGTLQTLNAASLTLTAGAIGMGKMTASASAPGAAGGKLELVCGTNAGTAKLIIIAGTSATAVTVTDNIGAGVTGC